MRHAEVVGSLIEQALAEAGVLPHELDGVVAGMGPGPFTGLRVGIAAARAFALGAGIPVVPMISHDAVAHALCTGELLPETEPARYESGNQFVVSTDARRKEQFYSLYTAHEGYAERIKGPSLAGRDERPHPELAVFYTAEIPAASLAWAAVGAQARGDEPAMDSAVYLRSPDVTPSTGPKRVTRR